MSGKKDDLRDKLKALLDRAQASAGPDFSGLGVIVSERPSALPIFPIGPPIKINPEADAALSIASISIESSPHHDGFHILDPDLKLVAISQYFSPPVVQGLKIDHAVPFGGRYLAALFGSALDGVLATGIVTPALGAILFIDGAEVSDENAAPAFS
jgi:hypothetical protein